jgi:hypothetical protein
LAPIEDPEDYLGPELAPDLLAMVVAGDVDTRTLKRLRPEPPVGKFSPYFAKRAPKSEPPTRPSSPYFAKYKSKSTKQVQEAAGRTLTSYFQLMPDPS